jgi:hypothetical protein
MALTNIFDRVPPTVRVILARWFVYIFATLPGLIMLQGHLGETIGKRPWFQDAQMPLDVLNTRLLISELFGGTGLLLAGVLVALVLQLIWLAGAVRVLDPNAAAGTTKVFANGRPYLWRYMRIAFFALLVIAAVHLGLKGVFESLASRAELAGWPVDRSYIDLMLWRGGLMFVLLTLIGVFVFWARVLTAVTDERKLRRLPRKVLGLFRSHFGAALLLQFAAITIVLLLQAAALYAWRQAGGGTPWYVAWLLILLIAAWVWQWRVSAAVRIASGTA